MHWMLSTVNYTPPSLHSFIREDSLCILASDLCNFPSKMYCDDRARNLYTFHCFIRHQVIFLCCHCTHVFMYRMCILMWDAQLLLFMYCKVYISYWMQTHIWSIKLSMTNQVYLWCSSVWDCQVVMLETVINSVANVFQLNKRIKRLTF